MFRKFYSFQVTSESNFPSDIHSIDSIDEEKQVLNIPKTSHFDMWRQDQTRNGNSTSSVARKKRISEPLLSVPVLPDNSFQSNSTGRINGTKYVTNIPTQKRFSFTDGNFDCLHGLFTFLFRNKKNFFYKNLLII